MANNTFPSPDANAQLSTPNISVRGVEVLIKLSIANRLPHLNEKMMVIKFK